jgi:hypothetical protein
VESPVFVDYLSMYQVHPGVKLPLVNKGCVWSVNEDGEIEWTTHKNLTLEGSFGTKLMLRCDGSTVQVSGNIGRFRRPDNLFGYSYEQCVRKWNEILNDFCLPPFTPGEMTSFYGAGSWSFTGAINTRIDVTKNYCFFNRDDLAAYMTWLGSQQRGRLKVSVHADGGTVDWGQGSKYVYEKFYDKFLEMMHHAKRKATPQDVLQYVKEVGVGRHELTLKSRFLTQNGLRFLGETNMSKIVEIYRHRSSLVLENKLPFNEYNDIPMPYRATAKDWRDGLDLSTSMSTAKYYRHRNELRKYGIDIAVPCDVRSLPIKIKEINVAALVAPDWYRQKYA